MIPMAARHLFRARIPQRLAGCLRREVRASVFEAGLRITTISAARGVIPSTRFALNELFLVRGIRRYTLRRSGWTLFVRHPVTDAWVVNEVVNRRVYQPPPPADEILRRSASPRIVDLGAHIGATTLLFFERFPNARILAVEPQPENAALLRKTLAANHLDGQCKVRRVAAGVAPGTAAMEGSSLLAHCVRSDTEEAVDLVPRLRKYQANGTPPARVEVVDVIPLLEGADLVKMDIEGAEWPILADPRFASLKIPAVVLEYHPQGAPQADTLAAVRDILGGAGYTVDEPVEQHGSLGLIWAWRD